MIERTITSTIRAISRLSPVILLTGMRQVGKSTVLDMLKTQTRAYVSLDNLAYRTLAKNNPELFLQRFAPPIIIDEVQYAPELLTYIKIIVDNNPRNGQFWLTGSQKFNLMEGIQESLAGRVAVLDLLGFSYSEKNKLAKSVKPFLPSMKAKKISNKLTLMDLYKNIFIGSFPKLVVNKGRGRDIFFKSYLLTYIQRDVKDYHGITDDLKFYNFVRAVAVRTGNLLNFNNLSRDVNIDVRTARQWLNILERSGVVKLLYPYSNNVTKRIIKTPKVYFMDTGLCTYLAGIDTHKALEASYLSGSILETYVFAEIMKSYWHNGQEPLIYFYRDTDQKEVDFLIEKNGELYPIEVKKTATPSLADACNFKVLSKLNLPVAAGVVLCLTANQIPLTESISAVPVWDIG
ncbi:ATPase [Bacteroidia bacterium]|nr:ATPase [Bacteroidia bacterium]